MMNRLIAMLLVAFVCVGCSQEKGSYISPGSVSFDIPSSSGQLQPASLVTGTWTGTATASHGESGTLSATFTQPPTPDQAVSATIAWTSNTTSLVFNGVLTGTIDNLNIDASNLPGGCTYKAVGALNEAGTIITGNYTATGPGSCPQKAGSFTLSGGSYVPPVVVVDVCPNLEGNQASVPEGYQLVEGQCTVIVIPPPVDVCPNLEGNQATVPAGYQLVEGQCTVIVIPPPVDVCPNLEGNQASVPAGYQLVGGQCTLIVIPPTPDCTESFWQMNQGSSNAVRTPVRIGAVSSWMSGQPTRTFAGSLLILQAIQVLTSHCCRPCPLHAQFN